MFCSGFTEPSFSLSPSMSTRPSVMLLWTVPMDCWSVMSICRMVMVSLCRSLTLSSKRCFLSRLRMVAYTKQHPQSKMQSIIINQAPQNTNHQRLVQHITHSVQYLPLYALDGSDARWMARLSPIPDEQPVMRTTFCSIRIKPKSVHSAGERKRECTAGQRMRAGMLVKLLQEVRCFSQLLAVVSFTFNHLGGCFRIPHEHKVNLKANILCFTFTLPK